MASKRPFPQEEEGESSRSLAKRISLWNVYYGDVTNFAEGLSVRLEPLLRGVLREEIPRVILNCENSNTRPSINQVHGASRFRLHFRNRLSHNLFTNRGILSEHKTPIQLAIVDTNSNETVTSEPWASLKVKIVAVRGDFNRDGCTTWSREEFESHVESRRDGRKPLLTGKINVTLSNGVGVIHDACFTDNSRWTRSGMFRLGAVISDGRCNGERVQEAISEAVKVKDARVEMSQKDSPPSLNDEVFCLKKIQKGGPFHKKLKAYGINTVQDFLRSYVVDHNKLRTVRKFMQSIILLHKLLECQIE